MKFLLKLLTSIIALVILAVGIIIFYPNLLPKDANTLFEDVVAINSINIINPNIL